MIKVLQFGEGNFLRTFADAYFNALNKEGGEYEVNVVKPRAGGSLEKFVNQNNRYHVILRGVSEGKAKEKAVEITALKSVFSLSENPERFFALAKEDELKIIISNTTEAGIRFDENDEFTDVANATYPAKLTAFLYERYLAGKAGVYILPAELIDDNAEELKNCANEYIGLWKLPEGFKKWNEKENYYCNTLVDRIVSGYPKDEKTEKHLTELIGVKDALMTVGEPFGLWAIEKKGDIERYIKAGKHDIEVVLTDDVKYYKKRKVRVLNGSHTNLVYAGLWQGKHTVYDCMTDEKLLKFVNDTLKKEIIPFVSSDIDATTEFAESVKERFLNPYLNHELTSIALNSIDKWKARVLPSFKDYYEKNGKVPENLTKGFASIMAAYKVAKKGEDGKYYAKLPARTIEIKDDEKYLGYFVSGGCVIKFMQDESVWGEDLTKYAGFAEAVKATVKKLLSGDTDIL